jgi:hypothetical protein
VRPHRPAIALIVLGSTLFVLACGRDRAEGPRAVRDTGLVPVAAANGSILSADGSIRAPAPSGAGWECFRQDRADATTTESLVQCWRRASAADFVLTLAKEYVVPTSERMAPEALARGPYREGNEGQFRGVRYMRQEAIEHRGRPAFESELTGTHPSVGEIYKRERVFTSGDRVFILQAEGNPGALERHRELVEAWFADTQFTHLER